MSKLKQEAGHVGSVSLKHAAAILNQPPTLIDGLVRRKGVVKAVGRGGRGGELRLGAQSLLLLDVAARLESAHVPRESIRTILDKLEPQIDSDRPLTLICGPGRADVVDSATVNLGELLGAVSALTLDSVIPRQRRAAIERSITEAATPARRGRPKLDRAWVLEKLDSTVELGDDDASPEDLALLSGGSEQPAWRRAKAD